MDRCNTYNYRVYGLNIKSQIRIDEFIEIDNLKVDDIDVDYEYGSMPERCYELLKKGVTNFYEKNEIWFHVRNVASYYICNGNKVIVEPCKEANNIIVNVFLMCSCLGFIMLQRDKVAIHGGTIIVNDKAVILTGDRGAGKSTLTTALRLKGHKFISDDVAAVEIDDEIKINHGFPYQKLCKDAMINFNYDYKEVISFMSDSQMKYIVPAHNQFTYDDTKLLAVVEIVEGDVENILMTEIRGSKKLNIIIKNIYRGEFMPYWGGITNKYFTKCLKIANNIKCYKIIRPRGKFTVEEQVKFIEELV